MKKRLIIIIASFLLLSACSSEKTVAASKTSSGTEQTTTAAETTEAETTAAVTETETTEEPEPEIPMREVKLGEMTIALDPSVWETVDEYIERTEKRDSDYLTEEDKAEMRSYGDRLFVLHDSDALLWLEATDFNRGDVGFGTDEDYEAYAQALNASSEKNGSIGFRSELAERNGIPFLDSFMTGDSGSYTRLCTIMNDDFGYSIMLSNYTARNDREYLYSLFDNISFEQ